MTARHAPSPLNLAGRGLALLLSLAVILITAFFVIDEANARFGAMAASVVIVALTAPMMKNRHLPFSWLIDLALIGAFLYAALWFFRVKAELYTGFFMANPDNIRAGLLGMGALLLLTYRAWGASLVIMALAFVAFGFAGPNLPGLFEYINGFYNPRRRHSALGWKSPLAFERKVA